jgi:hypothetical protein
MPFKEYQILQGPPAPMLFPDYYTACFPNGNGLIAAMLAGGQAKYISSIGLASISTLPL